MSNKKILDVLQNVGQLIQGWNATESEWSKWDKEVYESVCDMRTILKNGYTDDIWECFNGFFTERFEHDLGMIESEII